MQCSRAGLPSPRAHEKHARAGLGTENSIIIKMKRCNASYSGGWQVWGQLGCPFSKWKKKKVRKKKWIPKGCPCSSAVGTLPFLVWSCWACVGHRDSSSFRWEILSWGYRMCWSQWQWHHVVFCVSVVNKWPRQCIYLFFNVWVLWGVWWIFHSFPKCWISIPQYSSVVMHNLSSYSLTAHLRCLNFFLGYK